MAATAVVSLGVLGPGMWCDEAASVSAASKPLSLLMSMLGEIDLVHGFYYIVLHFWIAVAGTSLLSLRALSLVVFGLAVVFVAQVARSLSNQRIAAWAAGLLMATLPGVTWAAGSARTFSFAVLFVSLHMLLAWTIVRRQGQSSTLLTIAFSLSIPLMVFSEIYTVFVLPASHLLLFGLPSAVKKRTAFIVAPAWLVAMAFGWACTGQSGQLASSNSPAHIVAGGAFGGVFLGVRDGRSISQVALAGAVVGAVVVVLLALAGLKSLNRTWAAALMTWALLPALALIVLGFIQPALFQERYLAICVPAYAVAAGIGLSRMKMSRAIAAALTVAILFSGIQLAQRGPTARIGDDYTGLARLVQSSKATVVIYDYDRLRGIGVAYPAELATADDVRLNTPPQQSAKLWGESVGWEEATKRLQAKNPHVAALVYLPNHGLARSRGAQILTQQGCHITDNVTTQSAAVAIYQCR